MPKKPSAGSARPPAGDLQSVLDALTPASQPNPASSPDVATSAGPEAAAGAPIAPQGPNAPAADSENSSSRVHEGVPPAEDAPLVELSPAVYDDLAPIKAIFTEDDTPPPGFTPVEIKPYAANKPLTAQIPLVVGMDVTFDPADPLAEARQSLQEDAARARAHEARLASQGGDAINQGPRAGGVPALKRPQDHPSAIREAMARAAASTPTRYRSRVTVAAAWQFLSMATAPEWIDKNWIGYDQGPAVIVPDVGAVHRGDWVVLESILADDGQPGHQQLKVYTDELFRSLFLAERSTNVPAEPAHV